ncbi:helix-turn-helix domain-containing protein, partial [Escherichia coli]|nr:helix-turn-helix domain-containing protein [Escherichia coli]MBC9220042.1 helix-turn-helix domain-containing protein [Escherichia coli]
EAVGVAASLADQRQVGVVEGVVADQVILALRQRATAGEPKAQLAREFNISRETLYQYLRTDD